MRKEEPTPEVVEEESTIFGQHETSEELRRKQKEQRRQERQVLKKELAERSQDTRRTTIVLTVILLAIVALCAVAVIIQLQPKPKDMAPESAHFVGDGTMPELSQAGIFAEINEAYFTNDGSFALVLNLSNGLPSPQSVDSCSLTVKNGNGEVIATGQLAENWNPEYRVPANSYEVLTIYIPAEDVLLPDDPLTNVKVTYTIEGTPDDPSVLLTTTAPTTTTTEA